MFNFLSSISPPSNTSYSQPTLTSGMNSSNDVERITSSNHYPPSSPMDLPPSYEEATHEKYIRAYIEMSPKHKELQNRFTYICSKISLYTRSHIPLPRDQIHCGLKENGLHFCAGQNCTNRGSTVWGTDIFTSDSSPCNAAKFCGIIGTQGGYFRLINRPGLESYGASTRNGISTHHYGPWDSSFVIEGAPSDFSEFTTVSTERDCGPVSGVLWYCAGANCSNKTSTVPVIGSGIYAGFSNICAAAVHAGVVSPNSNEGVEFCVYPFVYQNLVTHATMTSLDKLDIPDGDNGNDSKSENGPSSSISAEIAPLDLVSPSPDEYYHLNNYSESIYTPSNLSKCIQNRKQSIFQSLYLQGSKQNNITSQTASLNSIITSSSETSQSPFILILKKTTKCFSIPLPNEDKNTYLGIPAVFHVCLGSSGGCPAEGSSLPNSISQFQPNSHTHPHPTTSLIPSDTTGMEYTASPSNFFSFGTFEQPQVSSTSISNNVTNHQIIPTPVFGTVIYTGTSHYCAALVHSGLSNPGSGGFGIITRCAGRQKYIGSTNNNIVSQDHGPSPHAFRFYTIFTDSKHIVHEPMSSSGFPPQIQFSTPRPVWIQVTQDSKVLKRKRFMIPSYPVSLFSIDLFKQMMLKKFPTLFNSITDITKITAYSAIIPKLGSESYIEDTYDISIIYPGDVITIHKDTKPQ